MKFISLLIALIIIGLLVKQQLEPSPSNQELEIIVNEEALNVPQVPNKPEGIEQFEKDINKFMIEGAIKKEEESLNY
jgi:hypothetical protein